MQKVGRNVHGGMVDPCLGSPGHRGDWFPMATGLGSSIGSDGDTIAQVHLVAFDDIAASITRKHASFGTNADET